MPIEMKDQNKSEAGSQSEPLEPPAFNPNAPLEPPTFSPDNESDSDSSQVEPTAFTPEASSSDAEIQWSPQVEEEEPSISWTRWILFALTLICIASAAWFSYSSITEHSHKATLQLNSATAKATALTEQLDSTFLKPAETLVEDLQGLIQHKDSDLANIKRYLLSDKAKIKPLAVGVAYLPNAFKEGQAFYSPFYQKDADGQYVLVPAVEYDYTRLAGPNEHYDSRWFVDGMANDGGWQEPYYGTAIQDWIAEYSLPIYKTNPETGKKEKVGLVLADFSLEDVREMVRRITLNNLAYGYLVSPQGILVSHPDRDLLGEPLLEAYTQGSQDRHSDAFKQGSRIVERMQAGENFIEEFSDEATGQTSLVLHREVPKSHWSFGIVMPKNDIYALATQNKERILYSLITLALAIVLGIATLKYSEFSDNELPWLISSLLSIFAVIITIIILILFWNETFKSSNNKVFTVAETLSARGVSYKNAELIPTGILITDIEFPQPQTAAVGGVIWQKFALQKGDSTIAPATTPAGIIWPDAKLGSEQIEALREYKADGFLVKSWRFHVNMALDRSIGQFPFDLSEINLRMRSSPETKALLVPDFEAYDILIPEVKPGIDPKLELSTWNIKTSFFSVENSRNQKYFGTQIEDQNKNSEISFKVQLARQSHAPLISHFIPVCISSIMMFVVLMIPSDRSAGSVFSVLGYGGSIFFLVSLFHVGLRSAAGIDGFTYLESYYILLHVVIMLVSLNGFLLMRGSNVKWVHYRNNLLPKVIYWPLSTLTLLVSTIAYFM